MSAVEKAIRAVVNAPWIPRNKAARDGAEALVRAAVGAEREACAEIALAQDYYPDTNIGKRQQWVKEQIATKIRARSER